jgi:hypothetical protein
MTLRKSIGKHCRVCISTQKHLDAEDYWVCERCTSKLYDAEEVVPKVTDVSSAMKIETESPTAKEDEKTK